MVRSQAEGASSKQRETKLSDPSEAAVGPGRFPRGQHGQFWALQLRAYSRSPGAWVRTLRPLPTSVRPSRTFRLPRSASRDRQTTKRPLGGTHADKPHPFSGPREGTKAEGRCRRVWPRHHHLAQVGQWNDLSHQVAGYRRCGEGRDPELRQGCDRKDHQIVSRARP